ncbi:MULTISPECIES: DUF6542 domain-containing protein [unclassified Rhodococcus (in: high G+C Gram-positive bacteria)]|uniref:DUF6542 domain-containing protein n=1 Tax=unclassified Rhodococcus (in: high G+C Gram-positive bacteria) TaxID=192944 RepID=UPI00163AAC6C|nr:MULTISPECIES: DUF6542 domain-containing protein [unclassified Rhodococcus (in: high G+C Gram-positive bacteria)]MBC2643099.1 hypothetical protein [Rhodococcus sp. 3A]MBC2892160.1 hypothetical protein [Rhodococcus sp. 4CII]
MSATQRARSGVPLDRRSIVPTVPGLPWWGVILLAVGVAFVGFAVDAARGTELTAAFSTFYFLGCVLAVAAASNRALFTAIVQPPLILFVAVPLGQSLIADENSTALRDLAINIAYPLVNRFPVMLAATVVALLIGGLRLFLLQQRKTGPARTSERRRSQRAPRSARPRRAAEDSEPTPPPRRESPRRARNTDAAREHPRSSRRAATPPPRRSASSGGRTAPPPMVDRAAQAPRSAPPRTTQAPHSVPPRTTPRPRPNPDVPAHPIPQVRYRDRYEPPFETEQPR